MIPVLNISIWEVAKVFVLFAIAIYIIFASVVVKQVNLMTETLEVEFEEVIKTIVYLHLAFSLIVFVFALTTL